MLCRFNDQPTLTENREIKLNEDENQLFKKKDIKSDNEDFGNEGTLYVTNNRIVWVSTLKYAFEAPLTDIGVFGLDNTNMFIQIDGNSFFLNLNDKTSATELDKILQKCVNDTSTVNDDTEMANETDFIKVSKDLNSNNPDKKVIHTEVGDLEVAETMEDFQNGGWITSESLKSGNFDDFINKLGDVNEDGKIVFNNNNNAKEEVVTSNVTNNNTNEMDVEK